METWTKEFDIYIEKKVEAIANAFAGALEEKGKVLRGKKKKKDLNPVDKMGEDDDQIQEIREQNEEMTQQVHEKVEEKQSKCKCFIF